MEGEKDAQSGKKKKNAEISSLETQTLGLSPPSHLPHLPTTHTHTLTLSPTPTPTPAPTPAGMCTTAVCTSPRHQKHSFEQQEKVGHNYKMLMTLSTAPCPLSLKKKPFCNTHCCVFFFLRENGRTQLKEKVNSTSLRSK